MGSSSTGRLIHDADPAGGSKTLAHTTLPDGYEVSTTTGMGRSTVHRTEEFTLEDEIPELPGGGQRETTISPTGLQMVNDTDAAASTKITSADGTSLLW